MLCYRLFAKKPEKQPLLADSSEVSPKKLLEAKYKANKGFITTCKDLRSQIRTLWQALEHDPKSWGAKKEKECFTCLDNLDLPSITWELKKLINLKKELVELSVTYKDFVLSTTKQLDKKTDPTLMQLISEWRQDLLTDLQSIHLGAKVLCEPQFYNGEIEKLSRAQDPNQVRTAEDFLANKKVYQWGDVHHEFLGYSKLTEGNKLLLNQSLFDLSFQAFSFLQDLVQNKISQNTAPALHIMHEEEHTQQEQTTELGVR